MGARNAKGAMGAQDGDAALRLLGRLKLRASMRKQLRKLRTPRGLILAGLGGGLFLLWIASIVTWSGFSGATARESRDIVPFLRLGGLVVFALSVFGALQHRGLYLPAEEIERLFSAPLARTAITRYRLRATLGRVAFGAVLVGLMVTRRTPVPLFGFLGGVCAIATVAVAGQMISVLAGSLERKLGASLHALVRGAFLALLIAAVLLLWTMFFDDGGPNGEGRLAVLLKERVPDGDLGGLVDVGPVRWLALPLEPWVQSMSAEGWSSFAAWFPLSVFLLMALYEATARLPIDYRELSLQTAASVAEKLRRMRRVGGGASASAASARTRALRVPFLFGRGPVGALAWRKSIEILRKARGTLWVSGLVLVLLLFISALVADGAGSSSAAGTAKETLLPCIVLVSLGVVYLCSGLRFDFRDDLDRMATIRSWPLRPTAVFVATLLPEFALVTVLLWVALLLRVLLDGAFHPGVFAIAAAVPPVVFAWLALDNFLFLLAPVRFVPGQEGALQNAGRLVVLLLLRVFGVLIVGATTGVAGAGAWIGSRALGAGELFCWLAALGVAWGILVAVDVGLALLGGYSYARFDVARDRG